jgi:anti-anti-sigma regulatory factor
MTDPAIVGDRGESSDSFPGTVLILAPPRLDAHTRNDLLKQVVEAMAGEARHIVVSFERCEAIDSVAIGAVIRMRRIVVLAGCTFTCARLGKAIRTTFLLSHLDQVLDLRDDGRVDPIVPGRPLSIPPERHLSP